MSMELDYKRQRTGFSLFGAGVKCMDKGATETERSAGCNVCRPKWMNGFKYVRNVHLGSLIISASISPCAPPDALLIKSSVC